MVRPRPERLPHEKGFHVSWDQLHRDARALAWRLDGEGPDDDMTTARARVTLAAWALTALAAGGWRLLRTDANR